MKQFLIILAIILFPALLMGQSPQLPTVVSASPQAKEFMKYIDYPVSLSSGLPEINVPVYTIKSKELTLPISLSYHASGFKPNDKDGFAGQGWSLNAGGRISRSVNNVPDEYCIKNLVRSDTDFPITNPTFCLGIDNDASDYLCNTATCFGGIYYKDTQFDMFYYSFPSGSGKFIFERNSDNLLKPVTLPFKPLAIKPYSTIDGYERHNITHFEILDERGTLYRFGKSVSNIAAIEKSISKDLYGQTLYECPTSWLLTEIISADKTDTISVEYYIPSIYNEEYHSPFSKSISHTSWPTGSGQSEWSDVADGNGFNTTMYQQARITKIKFKNGEIRIAYFTDSKVRIDKIEVYDKTSTAPLETVKLELTPYTVSSPYWYKLDAVKYLNKGVTDFQQYTFKYYPDPDSYYDEKTFPTMVVTTINTTYYQSYAIDYWGYYNGANSNTSLLSKGQVGDPYLDQSTGMNYFKLYGDAVRDPNPEYAKVGVLRQINYPTGGITTYEYEGNIATTGEKVGGLRVSKITNTTGNQSLLHSYEYNASVSTMGQPFFRDCFKSFSTSRFNYGDLNSAMRVTYTNSSSPQIDYNLNGQPLTYMEVAEYFGDKINNTGKIIHKFDVASVIGPSDAARDLFPGSLSIACPWSVLLYTSELDYGKYIYYQKNFRYGDIFEKETSIYDKDGNPRQKIEKNYSFDKNLYKGLYAKRLFNDDLSRASIKNQYFWKRNYFIEQLSQHLDSETTYDYPDNSGQVVTTTHSYTYNNNNLLTEQITDKSDGKTKIDMTYPTEETCTNCPTLVTNNVLTSVINRKDYSVKTGSSDQLLRTLHTDYDNFGKPLLMQTATSYNALQDEVIYSYHNTSQNLISVKKANNANTSYLWGYNQTLPIAKVENSSYWTAEPSSESSAYVGGSGIEFFGEYPLNGSFVIDKAQIVTVLTDYWKNSVSCTFKLNFYNQQNICVANITNNLPVDNTCSTSDQVTLPAGTYTVKAVLLGTAANDGYLGLDFNTYIYFSVDNPSFTVPFHTSFEEDNANVSTTYFKTGRKCHTGSFTFNLPTVVSGSNNYILTYWRKLSTTANWEYVTENITVTSAESISKTIGTGYAFIDEVRFYPKGATMTTYTYDPLVGMTSATDENNQTTYYTYDTFSRLQNIKDNKGNILKSYDYHYKQ